MGEVTDLLSVPLLRKRGERCRLCVDSRYRCKAEAGNDAGKKYEQNQTLGKRVREEVIYVKRTKSDQNNHKEPESQIFLDALPYLFDSHDIGEKETREQDGEDRVNDKDE